MAAHPAGISGVPRARVTHDRPAPANGRTLAAMRRTETAGDKHGARPGGGRLAMMISRVMSWSLRNPAAWPSRTEDGHGEACAGRLAALDYSLTAPTSTCTPSLLAARL